MHIDSVGRKCLFFPYVPIEMAIGLSNNNAPADRNVILFIFINSRLVPNNTECINIIVYVLACTSYLLTLNKPLQQWFQMESSNMEENSV